MINFKRTLEIRDELAHEMPEYEILEDLSNECDGDAEDSQKNINPGSYFLKVVTSLESKGNQFGVKIRWEV
ncbi:unnamed protein product [Allacma fusca]|uniref:Uncharacterized protein n=1 Tax=Allacma fusca TaxID=39272 RepID=A0A8J2PN93_9HEXA|nr:unnamed protein product [Allacma fusca]